MKAVLFPNLAQFPSVSMRRYASELTKSLRELSDKDWDFEDYFCGQSDFVSQLLPGHFGQQIAEKTGRLIKYPIEAAQQTADVFHVLDHSHAHLTIGLNHRRTVVTCHDIIPLLAQRGRIAMKPSGMSKYTFQLRLAMMQRCSRIIAISESTKRNLIEETSIPESKIVVVKYGLRSCFKPPLSNVQKQECRAELRARLNLPASAKLILQVATKNRYKNTPAIIKALSILQRDAELSESVWLIRIGSSLFEDERILSESYGLNNRIIETGHVDSDEILKQYYYAADLLAFPSIWEGFGWPPLEALGCGLPVVGSNVASLPEVIGDAGILIEPHDFQNLAVEIKRVLLDTELRNSMITKGIERAKAFDWTRTAKETLEVYKEIVSENSRNK